MAAVPSTVYTGYILLLAVTLLAVILSLAIVLQAYRGYRRNASRPMFFLAVGLFLLTVVPFTISIVGASLGPRLGFDTTLYTYYLPILSRLVEIIGLGCILYSLYSRR